MLPIRSKGCGLGVKIVVRKKTDGDLITYINKVYYVVLEQSLSSMREFALLV